MPLSAVIALCVLGGICILGAVLVMRYAFTFAKPKQPQPDPQPLPGSEGGGTYIMTVEGLQNDEDAAKLESALNKVAHTHAQADPAAGTVHIRYEGFPALDLLDSLRAEAERAGFRVTSIE